VTVPKNLILGYNESHDHLKKDKLRIWVLIPTSSLLNETKKVATNNIF